MSIEDNGGAAFPGMEDTGHLGDYAIAHYPGMTLRDYFAAKAMQSLIPCVFDDAAMEWKEKIEATAINAYRQADAMLEARKK